MILDDDFVGTLSDNDVPDEELETLTPDGGPKPAKTSKRKRDTPKQSAVKKQRRGEAEDDDEEDTGEKASDLDSEFEFDNTDRAAALGDFDGWAVSGNGAADPILEIVRRRQGGKAGHVNEAVSSDEELGGSSEEDAGELSDDVSDGDDDGEDDAETDMADMLEEGREDQDENDVENQNEDVAAPVRHPDDLASDAASDAGEDAVEMEKQAAFFAPEEEIRKKPTGSNSTFTSMNLSRPILKGLSEVKFAEPTPIQRKTIPVALEGKDIVGGAVTGSGKTAAFIIPILERLLYRPKRVATTRVAILMPTRELALQCLAVAQKLAAFTDVTFGRAIGGLNSKEQEKELKLRPDIVIATPGRFIDFMRNSSFFQLDKIEILVLDEADRMLEEGFADELNEILKTIPKSRQTMLFSATMTTRVDELVRVGMQRPVRLMVDAQKSSAEGLVQEFVRLRPGREAKRLGYLMHLCTSIHRDRVIVFFRQKKEAHRVRVVFALCGLKAAELHGSMSQEQRMSAMENFRTGRASFLLATDLASRGLDIKGVETVINYEAPQTHEIYLHRVGRTARAGRKGVSCTLAAEPDRKVVKAAVKAAKAQKGAVIKQRTVDPKDADAWQTRIDGLQDEIEAVLREEKEERALQQTEREVTRADNIVTHQDEIMARPKKTWFASQSDKDAAKRKGAEVLNGPSVDGGEGRRREKKGKLSNKQKKKLEDRDERKAGMWKKGKTDRQGGKPVAAPTKKGGAVKKGGKKGGR